MRYLHLLWVQLRLSTVLSMQYRWEFVISGTLTLVWTAIGLVPLYVAFFARPAIAGWSYDTALIVVGWFTLLKGVLDGAINPALVAVVERIRQGTLDFTLLKPADAQFLVSTAKFEVWHVIDVLAAMGIFGWAFSRIGRLPHGLDVIVSLVLLVSAVLVLYSMWIIVISAAFWVVRLDNLSYLMNSVFDFARWPTSVFKGVWAIVFTFVIPLGIMTTYPAQALLGTLAPRTAWTSIGGSLALAIFARWIWIQAIRHYRSASS
jgi:ABC-2 type transport system permease protein